MRARPNSVGVLVRCCPWPCCPAANTASTYTINTYHTPSTTNLHTHGLHIDGDSPQDSVFIKVGRCRLKPEQPKLTGAWFQGLKLKCD